MHALWSRAAQGMSPCSCRSCIHTATSLARRTTTAVTKRRIKASDVFTACYSTILATAAVADMQVKEERRKEWDRVIAEAKAGTLDFREPVDPGHADVIKTSPSRPKLKLGQAVLGYKPVTMGNGTSGHDTSLGFKLRQLGQQLEGESEYVEEQPDLELPAREPQTPVHLEKIEGTIARLVDQFLIESRVFTTEGSSRPPNVELQIQMEEMKGRLQSLMDGFNTLPSYQWNDVHEVIEQRDALHRSLHRLFQIAATDERASLDLTLAKISYNLLVSRSPPSVNTYNILLAEFIRLKQPRLAQIVVNSLMHDSKYKPSQVTVKLVLDHYRTKGKGDPNGFRSIMLRMRATRGKWQGQRPDMLIKRRGLQSLFIPYVAEWAMSTKTIHRYGYLHQKTPRDAAIFHSQILGSLELKGVRAAVRLVRAAFREGHQVQPDTLCAVAQTCLDQLDFGAGLQLIRNMLSLWEDGLGFIATVYTESLRKLIYQLLVMCGFDTSLSSCQNLPIKSSWDALQDLLHFMHVESVAEAVDRVAQVTFSLYDNFSSNASAEAMDYNLQKQIDRPECIDSAIRILDDYSIEQQLRTLQQREMELTSRWRRLDALEHLIDARWTDFTAVETELIAIMRKRLTHRQKRTIAKTIRHLASLSWEMGYFEQYDLTLKIIRDGEVAIKLAQLQDADVEQLALSEERGSTLQATDMAIPPQVFPLTLVDRPSQRLPSVASFAVKPLRSPTSVSLLASLRGKAELKAAAAP